VSQDKSIFEIFINQISVYLNTEENRPMMAFDELLDLFFEQKLTSPVQSRVKEWVYCSQEWKWLLMHY
jgi:hypothetical protein